MKYLLLYISAISLISVIATIHDKHAAQKGRWRTKENTLLVLSALGGSVAMFAVMRLIRHKTKHKKFMIGIPVIIVLQAAVIGWLLWKGVLM